MDKKSAEKAIDDLLAANTAIRDPSGLINVTARAHCGRIRALIIDALSKVKSEPREQPRLTAQQTVELLEDYLAGSDAVPGAPFSIRLSYSAHEFRCVIECGPRGQPVCWELSPSLTDAISGAIYQSPGTNP